MGCERLCRQISEWKNPLIVVVVPIVLLPLPIIGQTSVAKCAYAVLIIGAFWVLEVMPIAVTSLIPIFLFPLLGIMPSAEVCVNYANDTLMLFMGSLIVAAAVERWNLHKRIALRALTLVGPEPRWLMLGIMLPTWFLSMWMSNTATTAMMIPILNAILAQIREVKERVHADRRRDSEDDTALLNDPRTNGHLQAEIPEKRDVQVLIEMDNILDPGNPVTLPLSVEPSESPAIHHNRVYDDSAERAEQEQEFNQLAKTFALCTAYAANSGGIATLTGTPPNIILKGQADILYKAYNLPSAITFANWLIVGIPLSLLVFIAAWVWLQIYALGKKCLCCVKSDEDYSMVKVSLKKEYLRLGPMSFAEKVVLVDFVALALLWIMRNPVFMPGWGTLFTTGFVQDSTAAMFMSVLLFILPSELPFFKTKASKLQKDELTATQAYIPLLTWKFVNDRMAWGVLLLMGGGFALADGCSVRVCAGIRVASLTCIVSVIITGVKVGHNCDISNIKSGLSEWLSEQLTIFADLPLWLTSALLAYITAAITNVTSNAATATLFLPIVGSLAIRLAVHPLAFMIPCAIASSFAFMLPVGTPPNAIVFSTGYLKVSDMMKAGSAINIVSVLILCIAMNTFINPVFDLGNIPAAFLANKTSIVTSVVAGLNNTVPYNIIDAAS